MNTPLPEAKLTPIKEALFQGRKIDAIKLYREGTETGLAEAKAAIEQLEAELRQASPEKFSAAPAGKGCLGMVLALCLTAALVVLWLVDR
jgi:hypothetical protein